MSLLPLKTKNKKLSTVFPSNHKILTLQDTINTKKYVIKYVEVYRKSFFKYVKPIKKSSSLLCFEFYYYESTEKLQDL